MLKMLLFCCIMCVVSCSDKAAVKENDVDSGTTGSLKWALSEDSILTIIGKGVMPDYDDCFLETKTIQPPWEPYYEKITKLVIEEGVSSIGRWAFGCCTNLKSITFPNSLTDIGSYAFEGCDNLIEIIFQQETPPKSAGFGSHKTCTLFVPAGSEEEYRSTHPWGLFWKICTIDEPCTVIAGGRVSHSNSAGLLLTWWLYNDSTMTINLGIENTYRFMPNFNSMAGNGYDSAPWCNDDCRNSIINVLIEDGFTRIGNYTFDQCSNLISLTIPGSVTNVGYAFWGCRSILKIVCYSVSPPNIYSVSPEDVNEVFSDIDKTECVLYVPVGSADAYRAAEGWKDFVNIQVIQ